MANLPVGQPIIANGPFPIAIYPTFTNAARPAANAWAGGIIWNSDAQALQFSDGASWYNAAGALSGEVSFTSSGPLFVDVVFAIPLGESPTPRVWFLRTLGVIMSVDGDAIPNVGVTNATNDGFRIRTNAAFNGSVAWAVEAPV